MNELTELAIKAQAGNRIALGALIRQTQADVWQVCRSLGPAGQADDLTQEVYLKAMSALPNFRGDSSARTWLISIARNTAIDALRSQARRERVISLLQSRAEQKAEPSYEVETDELLLCLDQDQRIAFVLTQVIGLNYQEAADACGCPVGTIRSRIARAREHLVIALSDRTNDGSSRSAVSSLDQ